MSKRQTKKQRRMADIVARLQKYMSTYDKQFGYTDYRDDTFIDDVLYGLGAALDPVGYQYAPGFERFKDKLREHLETK